MNGLDVLLFVLYTLSVVNLAFRFGRVYERHQTQEEGSG